ncbi:MAG: HAMP domain-containing sensor histidine kinase [Planctomycetota bacterium]|nr:HAMP domain-containing sensor histidine kinase [Planctomycetota bacterium]
MEHEAASENSGERNAKSDWAILVAHDVRNLLSGAAGMAELLQVAEEDPEKAERLRSIRRQVGHAATLLEDLIRRSLVRVPTMERVDLGVVALSANTTLLARAGAALRIERIEPGERVHVRGRPNDLERALCNLMWNALEAMHAQDAAEPRLDLSWGRNAEGAFLEVRDYGPGLPKGALAQKLPGLGAADGRVHGLGLASVRQVMEEHGGRLTAENAATGRGATLRLQFGTQPELAFDD